MPHGSVCIIWEFQRNVGRSGGRVRLDVTLSRLLSPCGVAGLENGIACGQGSVAFYQEHLTCLRVNGLVTDLSCLDPSLPQQLTL